jgi:hypothetical protein
LKISSRLLHPLRCARPHFSTVAFSAKGRKLSPAALILKAASWGQHGTRRCDRRIGRRWRDDSGEYANSFLPLNNLPKRKRGDFLSPSFRSNWRVLLLLVVQFYRVARIYIFQREHDHG